MRTVRIIAAAALLLVQTGIARGESAACLPTARLVEVFAGAPGCPDAQYVVLEILSGHWYWGTDYVDVRGTCYNSPSTTVNFPRPDAGVVRYLIGTPAAESVFGVQLDQVVSELNIDPWGGWIGPVCGSIGYGCSSLVTCSSSTWNWPPGMAIVPNSSGEATFSVPAPTNSRGEVGQFHACTGDGGLTDAGKGAWPPPPPVCSIVNPPPVPTGSPGSDKDATAPMDADRPKPGRDGQISVTPTPSASAPAPSTSTPAPSTTPPAKGVPKADPLPEGGVLPSPNARGLSPSTSSNDGCAIRRAGGANDESIPVGLGLLGALGLRKRRRRAIARSSDALI